MHADKKHCEKGVSVIRGSGRDNESTVKSFLGGGAREWGSGEWYLCIGGSVYRRKRRNYV